MLGIFYQKKRGKGSREKGRGKREFITRRCLRHELLPIPHPRVVAKKGISRRLICRLQKEQRAQRRKARKGKRERRKEGSVHSLGHTAYRTWARYLDKTLEIIAILGYCL
jgi:hypothetical protein